MIKNKDGTTYKLGQFTPIVWDKSKIITYNMGSQEPISEQPIVAPVKKEKVKKLLIHCMPVKFENIKDDLYGNVYSKARYGQKFTFEGVIVEMTDLCFTFWSATELTQGSIIYPTYGSDPANDYKNGDYRWWQIIESEPKSGGFILKSVVSNVQPDFT